VIASRTMQAAQCDACGNERIGPVIDAVPGFHIDVTEVRAGGECRSTTLFLCSRRCAGKNVAGALDGEDWLWHVEQKGDAGDTSTADAEKPDAMRLAAG
jgi:hypothetical protein